MRLPNGYGSVYKLSGKRRRPWVARVATSWKTNMWEKTGEQQFLVLGYYEKQQDAIDALAEYHRHPTTKTNIALAGLFEEWKVIKYLNISEQTQNNYNAAWLYLRRIEDMGVKDIRTGNMQAIIDNPENLKTDKSGKPIKKDGRLVWEPKQLGRSSLEIIKALCTLLFGYAMENDIAIRIMWSFWRFRKLRRQKRPPSTSWN